MLTPEERDLVNREAARAGEASAQELAEWFAVRRKVARRAGLTESEALDLAVAEQHAMRRERRAAAGRKAKAS